MSFIELHTTKKYAKFINENSFSWSESTCNAISVYFLKLCENFTWFQKTNRDGVTCTFTPGKTFFIYEFGILHGVMIFYERYFK